MEEKHYHFSEIVRYALDIGEMTHLAGGEVSRVEDMISRICYAYGAKKVDVLTITSVTIVTVISPEGEPITQIRRVKNQTRDMTRLDALNNLSREICATLPSPDHIHERLVEIKKIRSMRWYISALAAVLSASFFTLFFGGSWRDFLATIPVALAIFALEKATKRTNINKIVNYLLISFVAGAVSVLMVHIGVGENINTIMIGAIMILIPGVSMTGAFEDLLSGDTITGLLQLCEATLVAVSIAVGFAIATYVCGGFSMLNDGTPMPAPWIQISTAFMAAAGFSVVFGFKKPVRVIFAALGGGLCHLFYILISLAGANEVICLLVATVIGAIYSQILARVLRTPATVFALPTIISLVPGRALYYTMSWALRGNFIKFYTWGLNTVLWALSIAFGLMAVMVTTSVITSIIRKMRLKKIEAKAQAKRK